MELPLEITYRNLTKNETIDSLVREQVEKLEKVCDHINSCATFNLLKSTHS